MEYEEQSLLQELKNIYGLNNDIETVLNYFKYVDLSLRGEIKELGNYNIIIQYPNDYQVVINLIDIITKVLMRSGIITDINYCNIHQLDFRYRHSKNDSRELIILNKGFEFKDIGLQEKLKQYVHSQTNKIFILLLYLNNDDTHIFQESLLEEFAWFVKIEDYSNVDKQEYIKNKLKQNHIVVAKNCNFVTKLAENNSIVINDELLNVVLKCKVNNTKIITDDFLGKIQQEHSIDTSEIHTHKARDELDSLEGLENVKKQIHSILNYALNCRKRNTTIPCLHMFFSGNQGCGKTTVAKIIGKIFAEEHILSDTYKYTEIHARDLVEKYVGWTAQKVKHIVKEAEGRCTFHRRILFII